MSARHAEVIAAALSEGDAPLEYLLKVMRDDDQPSARRDWAAEKATPYLHPRPAPLDRKVEFELPDTSTSEGVGQALDAVIKAVAAGTLSPSEGQSVVGLVEARRRAIETDELADRIAKLEHALPAGR